MPKEKNYNPVQAQRKADKAREVKKGKAGAQDRRNEKLARKNPDRLQKQIDDLKAVATSGGKLTRHEEQVLEGLEKEFKAVSKARDALGDKAPTFSRSWARDDNSRPSGALGKRRRGFGDDSSSDEDVSEDVRRIPMPRDTPPPIPKPEMDKWYAKRRAKRDVENAARRNNEQNDDNEGDGVRGNPHRRQTHLPEAKTVYEAKPIIRDLRKEAVSAFVPSSVQMKMNKGKGKAGLIEPEEADRLEKEGYLKTTTGTGQGQDSSAAGGNVDESRNVTIEDMDED